MNLGAERVLKELKIHGLSGVTVSDFPSGFRLAARIYDLKKAGVEIVKSPGRVATYKLRKPPLPGIED